MKTQRRFTPTLLRAFRENGRGKGTYRSYTSWHQITRNDPYSRGRSHHKYWSVTDRFYHLLSDKELIGFAFAIIAKAHAIARTRTDIREQFPLALDEHQVELSAYSASDLSRLTPGTLEIAAELGIRHRYLREGEDEEPWIYTTDLVVTEIPTGDAAELLAISIKLDADLKSKPARKRQLLEREYWTRQRGKWLLITPSLYSPAVGETLLTSAPWALPTNKIDVWPVDQYASLGKLVDGMSLTRALDTIGTKLRVTQRDAQHIFWQSVWMGIIPIDLSRSTWPSAPVNVIPYEEFLAQNPVAMERSICL